MPVNQQKTKDKIGLGLSGPAPLELGRSGVRDMVISAPRHPAAKHKRRRGPEDQKGQEGTGEGWEGRLDSGPCPLWRWW